jgi:asparagine synthase (glutamine-hydrolysing)
MRRRGPDHAQHRRFVTQGGRNVDFLHSRLNIIDLDPRSHQPLQVGSRWITFNGELYNYVELRETLAARGRHFRTASDTEVLLTAIDEFGWDALDRAEGMWAFALFNEEDGTVGLVRDRFAEKPLYLYRDEHGCFFGSEVKFIAALTGQRLEPDLDHLYRYLVNGYRALYKDGHTFFHGLIELPAASITTFDKDGGYETQRYWTPRYTPDEDMAYEHAVSGARDRVIRSMELRLRADVPLAFCMSGGIDSNSLICTASTIFKYDVHGFTITNTHADFDEQDMVQCVVGRLGVKHTAIPVTPESFLDNLRALVRQHDAPVYTISYYVHWQLQRSIAEHGYRVALSGTGADEIFSGYYDHHNAYLYEMRDTPAFDVALADWKKHLGPIVLNPVLRDPLCFIANPALRDHLYLDADEFGQYLTKPWSEAFDERHFCDSLLRNRMLNELFHESVPQILHEDDLNAMYYSIENRSPFLDRPLVEFGNTIPTRHLIKNGRAKAVLRDAMRGIVPEAVLDNRRKVGFNAPILDLLDVSDPVVRRHVLDDSPIYDHVRRDRIEALIAKRELPNSESKFLFYFLNAKMFLEEFGG